MTFISKWRRKKLYGELNKHLGELFRNLAAQKESWIEGGHLIPDHVQRLIVIPLRFAVSRVVGFIKGESAIYLDFSRKLSRCPVRIRWMPAIDRPVHHGIIMLWMFPACAE